MATDPATSSPRIVGVLENVRSLWNVGSMFRSADGAGLERLVLCGFTAHPPRPEIAKTALGAEEHVDWEFWSSAADACRALRADGAQILALETGPGSLPLEEAPLTDHVAFVVGHEITGVSDEVRQLADACVDLPMHGFKESLNVAVAFGIAAYTLRRRMGAPSTARTGLA